MEEIKKWTSKHEDEVQEYDTPTEELQNRIIKEKIRKEKRK